MILWQLSNQDWRLSKWPLLVTIPLSFTKAEQILSVTKQVSKDSSREISVEEGLLTVMLCSGKLQVRWRDKIKNKRQKKSNAGFLSMRWIGFAVSALFSRESCLPSSAVDHGVISLSCWFKVIVEVWWLMDQHICCCSALTHVRCFATQWTAASRGFLSFTISWSLLKLMFVELVIPPTISFSLAPFSSCPQSFSASGSFPVSQLFTSGGQRIGASALTSVLPMKIQAWFPGGLTGLLSLLFKGLSRVFSSTTVQRHRFFSAQSFLLSNSHICAWQLERS